MIGSIPGASPVLTEQEHTPEPALEASILEHSTLPKAESRGVVQGNHLSKLTVSFVGVHRTVALLPMAYFVEDIPLMVKVGRAS